MKIKKILAIILSVVMLSTMSTAVFAETYVVNEFDENYVICNEGFAGGEIANNMVTIEGTHEIKDGFALLRPGAKLTADLAKDGKSVKDGIVNVAFNFEPNLNGSETLCTATQVFDFGGGFKLEAQWSEYDMPSSWIKGGKFIVGGKELVVFNADGTGGAGAGTFRAIGSESSAPSLYYKINAKINFNTNKLNLIIVERETIKVDGVYSNTENPIVNEEYDYIMDTFEYFSQNLDSTGTDRFNSLVSGLKITTEGEASYAGVPSTIEQYPEGYVFEDKGSGYVTLKNGQSYTGNVKASSGIVDVSYRFWPSESTYETGVDKPVSQTFKFGEGFSFDAQWSSWGAAWKCMNGKFIVGNQTVAMNKDGLNNMPVGQFRPKNRNNATEHVAYYDIAAKINLDTKKINITIIEYLETTAETNNITETTIINNAEFNYNAASFDGFEATLTSDSTYMESYNSGLLIKASSPVTYDEKAIMTYQDGHIFDDKGTAEAKLTDGQSYTGNAKATSGIIDVSYRFLPTESNYNSTVNTATQTFNFGGGFSFNAQWSNDTTSWWCKDGKINVGSKSKIMNETGWNSAWNNPGWFRPRIHVSPTAAYGYYDISAKINLDTKKIYLTIKEYLVTTADTDNIKEAVLFNNEEFDYKSPVFDGFETSLTAEAAFLESYNSNLVIKADGPVGYDDKIVVGEIYADEGDAENLLTDTMTKQTDWEATAKVIDISYRFRPDMNGASAICAPTTQTFEFGEGFSFNAKWSPYGSSSTAWLVYAHFNIGGQAKNMNPNGWNSAGNAGWFRPKDGYEPFAYYDIAAQVNLDTKKIKVSIVEYLEMKDGTINKTEILPATEYDYNADSFNFFKTSLSSNKDELMRGYISKLFVQEYVEQVAEPEVEFVENKMVDLKTEKGAIASFEEFAAANSPSVNLKFKNETGNDINAMVI
ncbi:MAG: hypothetical protein U0M60_21560, partial [Clostridia bacterium]|nr:hypothetical protein [Clostridia bacterium]